MIYVFLVIAILAALAVLTRPDDGPTEVDKRIKRDTELRQAEWEFIERYGREPSYKELWAYCPPE